MDLNMEQLHSPDLWAEAWEHSRKNSPHEARKIRTEKESMEFWDKIAPEYGGMSKKGPNGRVEQITGFLTQEGLLNSQARILDVGSGPGTFAFPFAPLANEVIAVDGSEEMCSILNQKAQEKGLQNVKAFQRLWKDVDIEKEGWTRAFDLVFASMTPAINGREALEKMIQASRGHCCLVISTGAGKSLTRQALWKRFFQEDLQVNKDNFLHIFNLLSVIGYLPSIRYCQTSWAREQPVDKAVDALCRSFWMYMDITPEVKKNISAFVEEKTENGFFKEEIKSSLAVITWSCRD
ncbi:Methyltransferase type 11 [Desulfatibacillum aliphaticivorans]|uniref:Methyltransferase type 11 n=1 Tax=Desulfatibacillum aliphaticivorans TaxID=218208 RepID=B8FA50_DESAL|nr:class I SAM-dependent methyltransferase [Desulfatibacillum aliphaticivorans]ACL03146.1 Methyltransferase type 11 [Desulfatibacillum aliphaticivorans]